MARPMRVDVEDPARKGKTMPTYKRRSDIEQTIDIKKIIENCVLDSQMTLSLRELLGIMKEFHDMIVDLVKRKRHQSDEEEERPQNAKKNAITMARDEVDEDRGEERDRGSLDRPWLRDQPYVD